MAQYVQLVLLWTTIFGDWNMQHLFSNTPQLPGCLTCPRNCTLRLTTDRSLAPQADAILSVAMSVSADDLPRQWFPEQKIILFNLEPPPNAPIVQDSEHVGAFNWWMTYRQDAHVIADYSFTFFDLFRAPLPVQEKRSDVLLAWVAGDCFAEGWDRTSFVYRLSQLTPVHSYGRCLRNARFPPLTISQEEIAANDDPRWVRLAVQLREYKFFLALENCISPDYVTEKFWITLTRGSVPIVLDRRNNYPEPSSHSVIYVSDFNSVSELVHHLNYLNTNDTAYNEYLEWKRMPLERLSPAFQHTYRRFLQYRLPHSKLSTLFCTLCDKLSESREEKPRPLEPDMIGCLAPPPSAELDDDWMTAYWLSTIGRPAMLWCVVSVCVLMEVCMLVRSLRRLCTRAQTLCTKLPC